MFGIFFGYVYQRLAVIFTRISVLLLATNYSVVLILPV